MWKLFSSFNSRNKFLYSQYHCCGKRGYSDYTALSLKIPNSCYQVEKNNRKTFYPYGEGCLSAVSNAYLDIYRAEKWFHVSLIGVEVSLSIDGALCVSLNDGFFFFLSITVFRNSINRYADLQFDCRYITL